MSARYRRGGSEALYAHAQYNTQPVTTVDRPAVYAQYGSYYADALRRLIIYSQISCLFFILYLKVAVGERPKTCMYR